MSLAVLALAAAPVVAPAAIRIDQLWVGGSPGTWTDATRWSASWYLEPGQPQSAYESEYPDNTADVTYTATLGSSTGAVTLDDRDVTIDFFRVYANSTLTGSGNVTVNGDFDWRGGTLDGTGSVAVNGNIVIDSASQQTRFLSRRLNAYGTTTVTGSLYLTGPNSAFHNYGTFVLDKNADVGAPSGGIPTFYNHATFDKDGTGTSYVRSNLDNSGTLKVNTGTLSFLQGLTHSGTIDVAAGAKVSFGNQGTAMYTPASRVTGTGTVEFVAGTHNLGSYEATGPVTFGGNTNVTFNNTIHPSSLGDLYGTVNFNAPQSFPDVKLVGSAMGGSGDVEVTHKLTWASGEMRGGGTTTIPAGATLDLVSTNAALALSRPLVNNGTATLNGRTLVIGPGGSFTNNATFDAVLGDLSYSAAYGSGKFNNPGTYRKSGAASQKIEGLVFDNSGSLYVDQGMLELTTPFANAGLVRLAAGTTLKLSGNTFTGKIGSSLTGSGAVQVTGGTHTFAGGGSFAATGPLSVTGGSLTLNGPFTTSADVTVNAPSAAVTFNGATSLNNLTFQSGSINGTGAVTVAGNTNWSGGYLNAGGSILFPVGSSLVLAGLNSGGNYYVARPVETRGAVAWTNGSITFTGPTTWDNYGEMAVGAVTTIGRSGSGSSQFRNYGTITKTGTTTLTTDTLVNFQNYGTIHLNGGGLTLRDDAINAGTIYVGAGTTLTLGPGGFTNQPGSKIAGDGAVSFSGSTLINLPAGTFDPTGTVNVTYGSNVAINNAIHPATLGTIDGTVAFNADQTFPSLSVSNSGVVGGTGAISVTGSFTWGGGATQINSAVTLATGVTWDVTTTGNRTLNGSLNVNGAAHLTTGSLYLNAGSVLTNNATFELAGTTFSKGGTGSARIDNNGLFTKLTSSNVTIAQGITLNNAGTLDVQAGTLGLYDVPVQQTGVSLTGGTWIVRDGATLGLSGGPNITSSAATIVLEGPASRFDKVNTLTANSGRVEIRAGRLFTTAGSLTNSGAIVVGAGSTLKVVGSLANTGTVDLDITGAVAIDYTGPSPADAIRQQLKAGNILASNAPEGYGVGYLEAAALGVTTFGSVNVDATSLVLKVTWLGDANFDGHINADDYALIDRGLAKHLTGWAAGDFNHDGATDAADYLLADKSYILENRGAPADLLCEREARFGADYVSALAASVPEPTAAVIALVGGATRLMARRRRQGR